MDLKQAVEYIEKLEQALALKELIVNGQQDQIELLRTELAKYDPRYANG